MCVVCRQSPGPKGIIGYIHVQLGRLTPLVNNNVGRGYPCYYCCMPSSPALLYRCFLVSILLVTFSTVYTDFYCHTSPTFSTRAHLSPTLPLCYVCTCMFLIHLYTYYKLSQVLKLIFT